MSELKSKCEGIDDYELEYWITTLGSMPVAVIKSEDRSESYEMDRAMVAKLENGKYALISESGCSCYSSSDADIELFPSEGTALDAFKRWQDRA